MWLVILVLSVCIWFPAQCATLNSCCDFHSHVPSQWTYGDNCRPKTVYCVITLVLVLVTDARVARVEREELGVKERQVL